MFAAIIDREAVELCALLTIFVQNLQSSKSPVKELLLVADGETEELMTAFPRDVEFIALICSEISLFDTSDVKRYHRGRL